MEHIAGIIVECHSGLKQAIQIIHRILLEANLMEKGEWKDYYRFTVVVAYACFTQNPFIVHGLLYPRLHDISLLFIRICCPSADNLLCPYQCRF